MADPATRLEAALLDPRDDVATALVDLPAGRALSLAVGGVARELWTVEPIPVGHKLAVRALCVGRRIRKYGEFIGRMTQPAAAGAWVHSHNLATSAVRSIGDERAWRAQAMPGAIRAVADVRCDEGASPLFDGDLGRLHWLDAGACALHTFDAARGATSRTALPSPARAAVLARDGAVLVAVDAGVVRVDAAGGHVSPPAPGALPARLRWTALQSDARGCTWGTAAVPGSAEADGELRRLGGKAPDADVLRNLLAPSGLAFGADGATLYVAESGRAAITKLHVDDATREPGDAQSFADLGTLPGELGGMAIDAADHLWVALPGASCLVRFAPSGAVQRVVRVPVSRPTACAFGGERGARLYVTSAVAGLTDERRRAEPLAGRVLELDVGVRGAPPHRARAIDVAATPR